MSGNRATRINNARIIANALLSGKAEYVWLVDKAGRHVKVLKESLHKNEIIFFDAGNEVDFDSKRHTKSPLPLGKGKGDGL